MKVLGITQFHQKTYKLLDHHGSEFHPILGNVSKHFTMVVYGYSGNGKTEFVIRLTKFLAGLNMKVAWLSYEQRHDYDFQIATKRNNMEEVSGYFYPIDPTKNIKPGVSYIEDLDQYLKKRNSPEVIVIDSLDYLNPSWDDYCFLKEKYGEKKIFIYIAHSGKTGSVNKKITERIIFDGGMGLFVSKYIAFPEKNRFGGFEPYVIYEKRARLLNPLFFEKRMKGEAVTNKDAGTYKEPEPKGKGKKKKSPTKDKGQMQLSTSEEVGVDADKTLKTEG